MQRAVNTAGAAALAVAITCVLPTLGVADPGLKFEGGPWIPALAILSSSPNPNDVDREAAASSYAPLLAFAVEPEELGEAGTALQRTLGAADAGPIAIPTRVRIEPASGEGDASDAQWVPGVLVVARADAGSPAAGAPATGGQALEEREARRRDETTRWVPALAFTNGILGQGSQGSVESNVRPSAAGSATLLSPWMGASLELMTPSPGDVPGRPRFFLHGDLAANFGFKRNVAKEGAPGELTLPPNPPNDPSRITADGVVSGQGSTTSAEPQTLLVTAGAGIAFTLDARGRRIRVKPSIEYMREELKIAGVVNRARIPQGGTLENVQFIELGGSQRETYHGLGGGLEVETDAGRVGPLVLTLFVSGQGYRILGDRSTEFSDTDESGDSATWTFKKDAWSYRGGVGVRLRWLPD